MQGVWNLTAVKYGASKMKLNDLQAKKQLFNHDQRLRKLEKASGQGNSSGGSSGVDMLSVYPIGSIYMSVVETSPDVLFGGTWERIKDTFLLSAGDTYSAGATGGEATHTLTVDEMPSHNHAKSNGSTLNLNGINGAMGRSKVATGTDAYAFVSSTVDGLTYGGNTANTGNSQAHNNMPPYLAVYVWKRTA